MMWMIVFGAIGMLCLIGIAGYLDTQGHEL